MLILMFFFTLIFLVTFLMIMLNNLISKKTFKDREKNSPFECGFDPKNSARLPFSLQFFLIAIVFLIFDVEITMLVPMIKIINFSNFAYYNMIYMFFSLLLLMGLYHEWNQGALSWEY
uniref:NADH-ubiquinone oxidoreductase chain 3 n=1 Tax=Henosepilachna vigintioctopunctata TaxID=420089 RepID=A0A411DAI6_9CUCU|nr:NADH dehydrogenase subunit 3 [Henosepilachna vigintioctopunctata]QAY82222.1 NADH dehydrogenase subunit 3 [Henosepilachna vigintioctopunctata]